MEAFGPANAVKPITGTWALPFATYYSILAMRVSFTRVSSDTYIGDKSATSAAGLDPLLVASRSHGNFVENVPLALLMGAIVEMNGGNRKVLSGSFAALLAFRILHVELGIRGKDARGPGRALGHLGTVGFVLGMAGYAAYLGASFSPFQP